MNFPLDSVALAIFGEYGHIPDGIVHVQDHEPTNSRLQSSCSINSRSLRTEYSTCRRSARSNFSGAIDGRPVLAYSLLNRGYSFLNASSVTTRRRRKGCSWGTRCSGLT
jgi:hypothetical protein